MVWVEQGVMVMSILGVQQVGAELVVVDHHHLLMCLLLWQMVCIPYGRCQEALVP